MELRNIDRLQTLVQAVVQHGDFDLSAGGHSRLYVDCRQITFAPYGLSVVAEMVFDELVSLSSVTAVGGPALGAIPIVAAVVHMSYMEGHHLTGFCVRGEEKKHGAKRLIEGILEPGTELVIVDDVITTGGSILNAIRVVEEKGCRVVKVITLVDRGLGGSQRIRDEGYEFTAFLEINDSGRVTILTP